MLGVPENQVIFLVELTWLWFRSHHAAKKLKFIVKFEQQKLTLESWPGLKLTQS